MATFIDNRKAHFNYEVIEKFEAGVELLGFEVKSIRAGMVNLAGAFCIVRGGEVYLMGMHITPYQAKNTPLDYSPDRNRKLLLNKKEIKELGDADKSKGLTLIPLSLYSKGRTIKLELGIAKGKKLHDKRESIKKRDTDREIRRSLKE
ncbi:MAG: SsrA-binding protein SmpB [Candidatus Pacebacteria bacterium]|nr:SsrA-binding protein SmpB [Candidatus Paceibacterota bacterium]MBP9715876.1 SsrA-binding protein SmpB [Candidatus Paceibacterota bacterium]